MAEEMPLLTEKRASYLELFFDLVFVFAITQVSTLLREKPTVGGLVEGGLLLFMLWWTWSQYTWTTNWTGTDRLPLRLALIGAMGGSLLMAKTVPDAFADGGTWFGWEYFTVRLFAGAIYWIGARHSPSQRAALLTFLPLSLVAPLLVVGGGYLTGSARLGLWALAMAVDFASAAAAGRGTWEVDPGHFAERNGLFVIIALGESIVAIGLGASQAERTSGLLLALVVAFLGAAALWWSYFDRAARAAEEYLKEVQGQERGRFARDAYTLLHFPVVLGIVLYAVGAEEVVAHPGSLLAAEFRFALTAGVGLLMLAMVAGSYRAVRRLPIERLVLVTVLAALTVVGSGLPALLFATLTVGATIAALVQEGRHAWPQRRPAAV
jgi:low temperature requirement protein LtrA